MLDEILCDHRRKLATLKIKTISTPDDDASTTKALDKDRWSTTPGKEDNEEFCKPNPTIPKIPDYNNLDVSKAKCLIKARESSINSVTALIAKEEARLL